MSSYPANPLLARRQSYSHWVPEHVRWSDTDLVGHANNLAFGAFCETGRSMFVKHYVEKDAAERAMFLPAQLILNFLGEAFWPAQVDVGTGVLSVGRSSCRIGQGLFDGERCFGTAETVLVLIDEQTRRPLALPDSIRNWLGGYLIV
jgi:acyl-CoA thioester hydrolase